MKVELVRKDREIDQEAKEKPAQAFEKFAEAAVVDIIVKMQPVLARLQLRFRQLIRSPLLTPEKGRAQRVLATM